LLTQSIHAKIPARQRGVVLIIALIVLVAMTLAGIALVRSVDTSNIIAGNMAFQQSATHSGDVGAETAIAWLRANPTLLSNDNASNGYTAGGNSSAQSPAAGQSWDAYWALTAAGRSRTLSTDASGNTVSYVIDRLCDNAGSPLGGASCTSSPVVNVAEGNSDEANTAQMTALSLVYYRITSRIAGPRNTVSYIQTIIAL